MQEVRHVDDDWLKHFVLNAHRSLHFDVLSSIIKKNLSFPSIVIDTCYFEIPFHVQWGSSMSCHHWESRFACEMVLFVCMVMLVFVHVRLRSRDPCWWCGLGSRRKCVEWWYEKELKKSSFNGSSWTWLKALIGSKLKKVLSSFVYLNNGYGGVELHVD